MNNFFLKDRFLKLFSLIFLLSTFGGCGILPKFVNSEAAPTPPRIWTAREYYEGAASSPKPPNAKFITAAPMEISHERPEIQPALEPKLPDVIMSDGATVEPDQCWAQMVIPPQKKVVVRQLIAKEGRDSYDVQPNLLKSLKQTVTVRDAAQTYRIEPPQFKKVLERIKVKDEVKEIVVQPAVFRDEIEDVMVESERVEIRSCRALGRRIAGTGQASAGASHCAVRIPPVYKSVMRKVLVQAESVHEKIIPAKYETIEKWVLVEDGKAVATHLPSEQIEKNVITADVVAQAVPRLVPPEMQDIRVAIYENVPRLVWRRVVCEDEASMEMVKNLQSILRDKGFDVGVIDGKLGVHTFSAMKDFQLKQGIANGYLTYETLDALGLGN